MLSLHELATLLRLADTGRRTEAIDSDVLALSRGFDHGETLGNYAILNVDGATLKLEAHDLLPDATDPVFDRYTITK